MRRVLAWLVLTVLLAGLGWRLVTGPPVRLPLFDFVEYWAAGRLNLHGENPYDPDRIHHLEQAAGRKEPGVLMWNPPWTLPFVMPFGAFAPDQVHQAHLLWLLLQFAVLGLCCDFLWHFYGGEPDKRWLGWLVGATFVPVLFALTAGQISPLLLLGVVGFLHFQRQGQWFLAGVATLLLAFKPHLVHLLWLAFLLWMIRTRRWLLLAGGVLAGLLATALALAFNPAVPGQYWTTLTSQPPAQYDSPTGGTVLRLWLGKEHFWLQYLPMIPGLVWLAVWGWRRDWDWERDLPLVLLVSLLTAPYGAWPFDLVLCLPGVLAVAATVSRESSCQRRRALVLHLAINSLALALLLARAEYFWFLWMTPALLLGWLLLGQRRAKTTVTASS